MVAKIAYGTTSAKFLHGSISGRVHADPEDDCEIGPNDVMLQGVVHAAFRCQRKSHCRNDN